MRRSWSNQKVVLDARPLQGPSARRGIGTYVRGLIEGLVAEGFQEHLALLLDEGLPAPDLATDAFSVVSVRRRYHGRLATYEDAVALGGDLARARPALYHATTLSLPGRPPCPLVVTLHDLIPWAWGGPFMRGERLRYRIGRRALRAADLVLAVSQATAADAVRIAGVSRRRLQVIPEAAGAAFRPRRGAAERVHARWSLAPGRYLVYVGSLDARKDPRGLLRAWVAARHAGTDADLVLVGEPGRQAPPAPDGVRRLGHLVDEDLADLLCAAGCLVFPSRYEGFGLPVLEAMSCGCPVAAYDNSSIPEVGGTAALLVADGDAEALGLAAAELLTDPARSAAARSAGLKQARRYSWRRTARATIDAYEALLR